MNTKVKIAIVGVGSIAQVHIGGYKKLDNVEICAFCDINEERLKDQGKLHGVTNLYTDINEMLAKHPEIDAVSVCTWNCAHAECTIAALNAGKNVLCEKPMAMNTKEAEAMKAAADKNGKLLMIGFVRRHGNDTEILKDFIENDTLGELYYGKATYLRRYGSPQGWFSDKKLSGGGPLIDLGVHVIDLTRYLLGNPKPISVYGATFEKIGNIKPIKDTGSIWAAVSGAQNINDVEDLATALIRYDNGAVISLEASFTLNIKEDIGSIALYGTNGGAECNPDLKIYNETNGYMTNIEIATPSAPDFNKMFDTEIAHFVSCVTDGTKCIAPAEDGIEIMKILDGIYESARTGHEVILK